MLDMSNSCNICRLTQSSGTLVIERYFFKNLKSFKCAAILNIESKIFLKICDVIKNDIKIYNHQMRHYMITFIFLNLTLHFQILKLLKFFLEFNYL